MKRIFCIIAMAVAMSVSAEPYIGAAGGMLLPSGHGNGLKRAAQVTVCGGWYVSDFVAVEGAVACAPNVVSRRGNETLSAIQVNGLFHLAGIDKINELFGYERFDPFVTLGAAAAWGTRHEFGGGARRTCIGPELGIGAFYHFTESLSLRFDARALVGIDDPGAVLYSLGVGLQYNFE